MLHACYLLTGAQAEGLREGPRPVWIDAVQLHRRVGAIACAHAARDGPRGRPRGAGPGGYRRRGEETGSSCRHDPSRGPWRRDGRWRSSCQAHGPRATRRRGRRRHAPPVRPPYVQLQAAGPGSPVAERVGARDAEAWRQRGHGHGDRADGRQGHV